ALSGGEHPPVPAESDRVQGSGRDGDDVAPVRDVALATPVVPHGQCGTVGPYSDRVPVTAGDGDDVAPGLHLALSLVPPARREDRAVRAQAESGAPACGHRDHAAP